jgi:peptidoglycan/LPS O-acetylase OafA/YrhL
LNAAGAAIDRCYPVRLSPQGEQTLQAENKSRLLPLDALRGVAALIVATAHFSYYGGFTVPPIVAEICVWFFFCLSGYILSYVYEEAIADKRITLFQFFARRIARLYPLHIITTAFMFFAWVAVYRQVPWSGLTIFEAVTLTQFLFGGGKSINPPSWSIGVEIWGSLLTFLICRYSGFARAGIFAAIALFFFLSSGLIHDTYAIGFVCFALGWAIFRIERARIFSEAPLPDRPMEISGYCSYGIYLWHVPVAFVLVGAIRFVEVKTGAKILGSPFLLLIYLPATIVVAYISYWLIESPAKSFLRERLLFRRPANA